MAIRFVESMLLTGFMSLLGFAIGRLVGVVVQHMVEHGVESETIRASIATRAKIERGLDARIRGLRAEMAKVDREIKEMVRKRIAFDQATKEQLAIADRIMRVVGDQVAGRTAFLGLVFNKYIAAGSGGNSVVDAAWATAQEVEVWAPGIAEARIELEKRYPPSFGFTVSSLVSAPKPGTPDPAADFALD
ncbi:MAG: hypothetical protein WCF85_08455 [Rhodospirillaceae bacterium]